MNSHHPKDAGYPPLKTLLEDYGADSQRWPEGCQTPVPEAAKRSAEEQAWLDEAQDFDDLLLQAPLPEPNTALMSLLLDEAGLTTPQRWFRQLWPSEQIWQPITALAASIALGFWIGMATPGPDTTTQMIASSQQQEAWQLLAFGPESMPEMEP
uniref:Uncharacterized protein n=1 Tax=Magnetococcus massalia (strain MO-1) TaxID=451514 RepID=A0A1S7LKI8_MAGMO|nr:conserved protein of unknown function [Candidatus Magnetococcus massalia]